MATFTGQKKGAPVECPADGVHKAQYG